MATARVERRLAARAADVVGYSRFMERDEAGAFARLKRLRHELVEPVLARHGGRFVDLKGDGAIVEFVRYRIGINLGEVIVDGDTIYGDGVNVAARIESLCEPGGVWLSRAVSGASSTSPSRPRACTRLRTSARRSRPSGSRSTV
jgi:adenylate cyclase